MTKSLNDLNASDLARIDAICLDFEMKLRRGQAPPIDDLVAQCGGAHADALRQELVEIANEINSPTSISHPPASPTDSSATPVPSPASNVSTKRVSEDVVAPSEARGTAGPPSRELPRPGDFIGPYRIESELGRGGMGVVVRATDTRLDRRVAIKLLSIQGEHYEELAERFQREAKAVARITHPNVVELFDIGSHNGVPYVVMELLQGDLLLDYQRRRHLSPSEVRSIGAQLADALATAHSHGVIHRDLKPQNVMLSDRSNSDGTDVTLVLADGLDELQENEQESSVKSSPPVQGVQVKLFDFGLSRSPLRGNEIKKGSGKDDGSSDIDTATRVGMIMGTPGYMAPEQARGESVSPAADIFSLGCVLHEAFYGKRAFDGNTPADRFAATLRETPLVDPIRRREDSDLAAIIESCLAKDSDARPASAAQLANDLRADASLGPASVDQWSAFVGETDDGERSDLAFSRRRFVEGVAGGLLGMSYAGWHTMMRAADMTTIESIGVLSLIDANIGAPASDLGPVGPRGATSGEQLSVSLVNALSRAEGLTVPRFLPLTASEPAEYIAAAKKLQVDALVDGEFRRLGDQSLEVDMRIVSGMTGKLLWGDTVKVPDANSLVERKVLADRLASEIGRVIRESGDGVLVEPDRDPQVFSCINKGVAALDPDREEALRSSLMCFQHAVSVDGGFDEAQGGLATVALMLANRVRKSTGPDSEDFVKLAFNAIKTSQESTHPSIRLATAMYEWQIDRKYESAFATLKELVEQKHNDWIVHHQLGLLSLTLGDDANAMEQLQRAARLARPVRSVQADVVRGYWYQEAGRQNAITRAEVLLSEQPGDIHARGLLIDLYEDQEDYRAAANLDSDFGELTGATPTTVSREAYFQRRKERLPAIPYGPFDPVSNRLIHVLRNNVVLSKLEQIVLQWENELRPSMPLLLARHPALRPLRATDAAQTILPPDSA